MNAEAERELERMYLLGVLNALENLVRLGTVTWTDPVRRLARVKFSDLGISSGLLYVLAAPPGIPDGGTEEASGGSGEAAFAGHRHGLTLRPWMPEVDAQVLCLYLPLWNGDGFVLGEV